VNNAGWAPGRLENLVVDVERGQHGEAMVLAQQHVKVPR
jgi:hypothetical protein